MGFEEDSARANEALRPLAAEYLNHEPGHQLSTGLIPMSDAGEAVLRKAQDIANKYGVHPQLGVEYLRDHVDELFEKAQEKAKPAAIIITDQERDLIPGMPFGRSGKALEAAERTVQNMAKLGIAPESARKLLGYAIARVLEARLQGHTLN